MSRVSHDVCHIEKCGIAFGKDAEHLKTASKAIIIRDYPLIKIKMDNRGSAPTRKRNSFGGFMVGRTDDARSTGRIGRYYRFTVRNGWILINLEDEVI